MLEGLNRIEWHKLTHAYGPAMDMPDVIRALSSNDGNLRQRAVEYLDGAFLQQGTVTQAAAYAVPFLIELLAAPDTKGKRAIILLLARLAGSQFPSDPPAGERLEGDLWNAADAAMREGQERRWASATVEAVERGMPLYLRLLYDTDLDVRIVTPYLLSTLPNQARQSVPVLGRHLEDAREQRVRASTLLALSALATPNPKANAQLSGLIGDGNPPLVRIAAAGALVLLARERTPSVATAVLAETIAKPDPEVTALYEQMPWSKSGLIGDLAATLAWLGPKAGSFAVPLLCRALGETTVDSNQSGTVASGTNAALNCMRTLLHLAFDGRSRSTPLILARLDENQHTALVAIAQADAVWRYPAAASELLGALALPNTRAALRQSLQLPV